eukprot:2068207-Pyramimonas_sp.AAC.1
MRLGCDWNATQVTNTYRAGAQVRYLINAGANPNHVSAGGMTAVMHASARGHVEAIAALAALGATAHYESVQIHGHGKETVKASNTALLAAIDQGQVRKKPKSKKRKRTCFVSGVVSAPLPLLAQEDPYNEVVL